MVSFQKDGDIHGMTNPFNPGYLTENELGDAGFSSLGRNVKIARNCTIIGPENITIGSNVRIDGQTIITAASGPLSVGSHVHIASSCLLVCGGGVVLEDFVGVSHGARIFSASDDYSGEWLTGPTIPAEFLNVHVAPVVLRRHVILGAGAVILPGVEVGEGSAVGSLSLVSKSLDAWGIYAGVPAKLRKARSRRLLELETELRKRTNTAS
jgi:acetyltransferase-like isoleucine patch superfamily enzyme